MSKSSTPTTPIIVNHTFATKTNSTRIVHNGISYSPTAYALLVVGSK